MAILALVIAAVFTTLFFAAKKAPHPCRLLAPSALAVCACAVCLSATTYAWFSATSTSQVATIQAAEYNVSVAMNANGEWDNSGTYSVTLDAGTEYEVNLTATGSAATGYCELKFGEGTPCYTVPIQKDGIFTFTVKGFTGTLTITPMWGAYPTGVGEDDLVPSGHLFNYGTAGVDLFMMPEPPETPEPPVDPAPETPENPDNTYLVEDDTAVTTQE